MKPLRFLVASALVLALVACGEESDPPVTPAGAQAAGAEEITFGESLAQIRGHHLVSLELYEAGDDKGAAIHAGHPIHEILDSVASELDEHGEGLGDELESALQAAATAIAQEKSVPDVASAFEDAAAATERALAAVTGEDVADSAYTGSVIAALLSTAAHEYEEAVDPKGGIRLLAEYQDGYAFVREAAHMYESIEGDVSSASAEEAEEIEEAFSTLTGALPGPVPPKELADVLDVEAAAELIGHELEETVGAEPVEESDPEAVVAEIEELLTEIEEAYAEGDADAAAELSAEAYLENYEVIEAEIIELAPEVNEELEPLLGAELRRQIQAGAPQEEIESMIARARQLLHEALEALEGAH